MRRLACSSLLALLLTGCPEERPGTQKQIPSQRVPPAMPVDPAPAAPRGDAGAPPDAGAPQR